MFYFRISFSIVSMIRPLSIMTKTINRYRLNRFKKLFTDKYDVSITRKKKSDDYANNGSHFPKGNSTICATSDGLNLAVFPSVYVAFDSPRKFLNSSQ